jgi:hypothetical protein
MKKTLVSTMAAAAFVALFAATASAQTTAALTTSVTATTPAVTVKAKGAARLPDLISKGDAAIAKRIASLNALNTRIQSLKNVSASEKASISAEVQTNITGLTTLKAKLDADTDATVALTDAKSILGSFRIYALVIPQGYIASAADRVATVVGMMTDISSKLQARITAAPANANITAMQASLSDLNTKVADAQTNAQTAQNAVAGLVPDQGNATVQASNTAALKAARANIKVSTSDLVAARADAQSIVAALK